MVNVNSMEGSYDMAEDHWEQEENQHGLLLRSLHEEFLNYGLCPDDFNSNEHNTDDSHNIINNNSGSSSGGGIDMDSGGCTMPFVPSATGAFITLRYIHRFNRIVEVRALTMFGDLIVQATTSPRALVMPPTRKGADASTDRSNGEGASGGDEGSCDGDGIVSRTITFDVERWLPRRGQVEEKVEQRTPQEKEGEEGKEEQDESVPAVVAPTTTIPLDLREEFRSAVRSGLLLHLCPPRGQFADLFGIEEVLRWHVLGMLSAKDLAVFGMTSRAADSTSISDFLWTPLVTAEFPTRVQEVLSSDDDWVSYRSPQPPSEERKENCERAIPGNKGKRGKKSGNSNNNNNDDDDEGHHLRVGLRDGRRGTSRRLYATFHHERSEFLSLVDDRNHPSRTLILLPAEARFNGDVAHTSYARHLSLRGYPTFDPEFPEYSWGPGIGGARAGGSARIGRWVHLGGGGVPPFSYVDTRASHRQRRGFLERIRGFP